MKTNNATRAFQSQTCRKLAAGLSAIAIALFAGRSADAQSIGIQFVGSGTALTPTQSAGLPAVAQMNWNADTAGPNLTTGLLLDSTGATTGATLTSTDLGGNYFGGGGISTPAGNLQLTSGEWFYGGQVNPSLSNQSITLNKIPYADYNVYVYGLLAALGGIGLAIAVCRKTLYRRNAA